MPWKWQIAAVTVADAEEIGTGGWEPFAVATDDDQGDVILCKKLVEIDEDPDTSKATEVTGGLGKDW